jgi:flagellar hook assembly protein FlgD
MRARLRVQRASAGGVTVIYELDRSCGVSLTVYDLTGRVARALVNAEQQPGTYSVTWDGSDDRGRQVPHGVYFYRLDTPGFRDVKKAVVVR